MSVPGRRGGAGQPELAPHATLAPHSNHAHHITTILEESRARLTFGCRGADRPVDAEAELAVHVALSDPGGIVAEFAIAAAYLAAGIGAFRLFEHVAMTRGSLARY
jgi:hypothetical protein